MLITNLNKFKHDLLFFLFKTTLIFLNTKTITFVMIHVLYQKLTIYVE